MNKDEIALELLKLFANRSSLANVIDVQVGNSFTPQAFGEAVASVYNHIRENLVTDGDQA